MLDLHRLCKCVAAGVLLGLLAFPASSGAQGTSRFELALEGGPVWQTRNDVRIPNDASGTRFSLVDLVGQGPWPAVRLEIGWNINRRHGLRALLAPLSYTESGEFRAPVSFAGQAYAAGAATEATYQFNSWRLGYRYRFRDSARWKLSVGFTAKIRDAKIELQQVTITSKDTDVGFVPLLHFDADWHAAGKWNLSLDADGLAGGPGRAIDAALQLGYSISDRFTLAACYRTLEGGADVESVYNFAWLHYAIVSATWRL